MKKPTSASTILHLLCMAPWSDAFAPLPTSHHRLSQQCASSFDSRSLPSVHMATKSPERKRSTNVKAKSAPPTEKKNTRNKPKKKHNREIDRRKSPALWRDEMEYAIAPAAGSSSTTTDDDDDDDHDDDDEPKTSSSEFLPKEPPELMAPAGGWPQLKAAVANGADAVYLGLTSYSARARAANFDPDPSLLWGDEFFEDYEPIEGQPASLAHAVRFAHQHHVRVYVAFNTLVFDEELHEVQELIEQVWDCGADAVIIQDVGVAKIVKEVVDRLSNGMKERNGALLGRRAGKGLNGAPLEIHASTQQSVTCADGVSFAAERTNATRVVVGRELSLSEITQISTNTDTEIEAFVHGALCVSYSGQCFSSEAWGGRSANRGQCAQACRLPYGLIANGELKHLSFEGIEGIMGGSKTTTSNGNNKHDEIQYLLSPQDLCGLDQVEGLTRAGVSCLKIEGRLKDASYVAATTRAYRQAIDTTWEKLLKEQTEIDASSSPPRRIISSPENHVSRYDLTHVFARGQDENHDGLTPGFFEGPQHQRLVRGRSPRHRGLHVGRVVSSNRGSLVVQMDEHMEEFEFPLKRGDGIVVDRGMPQDRELGGPIYDVTFRGDEAIVRFGREVERDWKENDKRRPTMMAPKGAHVWKTADAEIGKRMRRLAELDPPKSPATVVVEGQAGQPLTVRILDERSGKVGVATSSEMGVLEAADGSGLNAKSIKKAIGLLGNSQWSLSNLDSRLEEGLWCPISWVKDTRRRALESLKDALLDDANDDSTNHHEITTASNEDLIVDQLLDEISHSIVEEEGSTHAKISVLARTYDQVDAICKMIESTDSDSGEGISEVIVDFLEIEGIKAAVARCQEVKTSSHDLRVVVASPRIIKPGEEGIWRTLLKTSPDAILVRSTGLLYRLMQLGGAGHQVTIKGTEAEEMIEVIIPELIGDFSLNAANAITAHELLESGLSRITLAYDLSANAITELATLLGKKASQLEVVLHQHMPIFHTEHCVFARFLSNGNSYQDCGHVCTRNTVHLRDEKGKDNLVLADMGCRNTVFSAESQSGLYSMNEWIKAGVGHLRIELIDESGDDAVRIASSYLQFMSEELQPEEVWEELGLVPDSNGRMGGVGVGSLRNSAERRSGELSSTVH